MRKYRIPIFLGTIILLLGIIVIFTTYYNSPDYGIDSDDSKAFELSIKDDQKVLEKNFGIYRYLPIVSKDPSFKIGYDLSFDESAKNYTFRLVLDAFSAAAREDAVKVLLTSDFGEFDPLSYDIFIKNYINPLENFNNTLPENFSEQETKLLEENLRIRIFKHILYDGNINTYRLIERKNQDEWEPLSDPKLIFSYSDLPDLPHALIKEINSL